MVVLNPSFFSGYAVSGCDNESSLDLVGFCGLGPTNEQRVLYLDCKHKYAYKCKTNVFFMACIYFFCNDSKHI